MWASRCVTAAEVSVMILIIGLVIWEVTPVCLIPNAKSVAALVQIRTFQHELVQHRLDHGSYPLALPATVPRDPWGNAYRYEPPTVVRDDDDEPSVWSLGAVGQPGGDGKNANIVSWSGN